ncbi:MAG: Holliday junction branch migration protein RuvA [Rickettsiales bacterium]|jgi:Holliday junction DNA helicase RuvA|nr:Holliday junction branch migration protein RuvA [Rickettsiales bacterium]
MIGKLVGLLDSIQDGSLILNVGGIGFRVYCSSRTLGNMPSVGEKISLFIETVVKEDSLTLFGFLSQNEQVCFNVLCRVNGVGNRVAIKIMGTASVDEIVWAIIRNNRDIFRETPGIGPKLAARIIAELQNCQALKDICPSGPGQMESMTNPTSSDVILIRDATNALEGLGYQRTQANGVVTAMVNQNPGLTLESVITESLRKINNF